MNEQYKVNGVQYRLRYQRSLKELSAIRALEVGEYVEPGIMLDIGLAQFHGNVKQ